MSFIKNKLKLPKWFVLRSENMINQQQYIANWHESFVGYIRYLLSVIEGLLGQTEVAEDNKWVLETIRGMLTGKESADVKRNLSAGVVKRSTLNKIAKINKDMADLCLKHMRMDSLVQEFWKEMAHIQIEQNKQSEEMRLNAPHIPIGEG